MTDKEFEERVEEIRRKHAAIVPADMLFAVEPGWLDLIDEALGRMENYLKSQGWIAEVQVRQIKEKFGSLRIYARPDYGADWPDKVAEGLGKIRLEMEGLSAHICEICGAPGEIKVIDHYHC
jgi:hypothetical protein